jgi:two-component system CheB/CheR fusion protein
LFPATTWKQKCQGGRDEVAHGTDLQKIVDQMVLNRFAPASVVVNEKLEIVQFIGQTGRFLDPTPGDAPLNLLKMVKGALQLELRPAFQRVGRFGKVRKEGVLIEFDGALRTANFAILPIKNMPAKEKFYLIVFEEGRRSINPSHSLLTPKSKRKKPPT